MDDRTLDLVNKARESDMEAIGALFERYREPLRLAIGKMLGPRYRLLGADSEDAAQDAILKALGRIEDFEYRGDGSFLAWLLKTAHFEVLNKIRYHERKRRSPEGSAKAVGMDEAGDQAADLTAVPDRVSKHERNAMIVACLDELPEREREIIVLRRFMELEMSDICGELDLPSPSAARALLSRAQARLMGVLARRGVKLD